MIINRIRERRRSGGRVSVLCSHPLTPRTSLYDNNFGPEGARALAETLHINTALTELK